jgi:hypothetical protein
MSDQRCPRRPRQDARLRWIIRLRFAPKIRQSLSSSTYRSFQLVRASGEPCFSPTDQFGFIGHQRWKNEVFRVVVDPVTVVKASTSSSTLGGLLNTISA